MPNKHLTEFEQRLDDTVKWFRYHADPHMSPQKFVEFGTTVLKNLVELHVLFALGLGVEAEKKAAAQTENLIISMKLDERFLSAKVR